MDKEKRNEIEKNSIKLATAIIAKTTFHNNGLWFNDGYDRKTLDAIIDYAIEKTIEVYKKIEEKPMEVYCQDLVVLSIDGNEPIRYYLTEYGYKDDEYERVEWEDGCTTNYLYMNAKYKPGVLLIGSHVGDTITYSLDDDKNEHTIKILSTRRTLSSKKLTKDDLICFENTEKKQKSK